MMIVKTMSLIHNAGRATKQATTLPGFPFAMTAISFEFYPPKTLDAAFRLYDTVQSLAPYRPEFVSVTYGAGGTTRQLTHEAVKAIGQSFGLNVAAHLTCVDASRTETLEIADAYAEAGVTEIVALRGDPPKGASGFCPRDDGFASSVELIGALAATGKFRLHVGAYPEKHPESPDAKADIDWLKAKIDAGASTAITQFFFEAETFLRFRDACVAAGITAPIVPGILPIENWKNVRNFAARCGTSVPADLDRAFAQAIRDDRHDLLALVHCTDLCTVLLDEGVEHLHFYTLNRPNLTRDVLHAMSILPESRLHKVA